MVAGAGLAPDQARQLGLYALLVAASRFVPVPLLDEVLPERLRRRLVQRLLERAGRSLSAKSIEPVYADEGGCLSGCIGFALLLPFKLLLFPLRKILALVGAAREVSQRMAATVLLGFAVSRCLEQGIFADGADAPTLAEQARRFRASFDATLLSTNTALFGSPLEAVVGGTRGLVKAGARLARRLAKGEGRAAEPDPSTLPAADRTAIDRVTGAVETTLARPEIAAWLADFDARFWQAWNRGPTR